ncbi:MAG: helix-turn-helix domain-containing protein [Acidobacteriia bacterium]|nr:helix-turn-helix domain-containing protein [Terriglobia bacterium]
MAGLPFRHRSWITGSELYLRRANSGFPDVDQLHRAAVLRGADKVADSNTPATEQQNLVLLTEAQAGHRLGVSLSTIRRWRKKKVGPKYFFLGGILRYRRSDLDDFVARHTVAGEVS